MRPWFETRSFAALLTMRSVFVETARPQPHPEERAKPASRRIAAYHFSTKSPHFSIWSAEPHGMIGTEDVEFFGEPSMMRSE